MKKFTLTFLMVAFCLTISAQRFTDQLGRGLVVVPTGSTSGSTTNFVSWRRLANEYYDVTYNLYKDGNLLASGLTKTSYDDNKKGYPSTNYQVAAVMRGVEQAKCSAVTAWAQYVVKTTERCPTGYLDITLAPVYDRNGNDVSDHYEPNDAEMADLDGDGELEIIIKRLNTVDAGYVYPSSNTTEFVVLDAYDVNWQTGAATLMWRIDCGPNMVSLNSTEIDIIAYDWDEDGKAEVVLRGADNMIVYGSNGKTQLYTIGDMSVNTRNTFDPANGAQYAWTHTGAEYLIYMNGLTGALYQKTDYPLLRLEYESTLSAEWGGRGYGHNSSKYFFGAPFLDGRNASLFMARGIYGTHKMIAMNLNKASHQWTERWRWNCRNTSSPWYGQGYHNFVIADVDEDGRDEIVYGSMVIDDNGKGLSTTGYGHGDAQHVSDFNPYRKGLEFMGCIEDEPYWGSDYRDATTGEVFYKYTHTDDDGRCLMGNFTNDYPGSIGRSVGSAMISSVSNQPISALSDFIAWGDLNFRIYWDGDLCSELLNGTGKENGNARIDKPGPGRLFTSEDCNMNNSTKNNACFQGDIIGDWREEIVVRCGRNLRVYTSGMSTAYNIPCLWFDHQYRQAMVWQMMAYNQPPHLSYFLGEMEGITVAPPPLTNRDRTEVANGGTISTTTDHLLMAETDDMTVNVTNGAAPYMLTVNTPTWVQGHDNNNNITTTTYTHTLTGGAFTGSMRLVKQGDGVLVLPDVTETYTGETNVWGGTLKFNGTLESSPVWMNRFTTLISDGGTFGGGISMDYASRLVPGEDKKSSITTSNLTLNHGARLVLDVYANDISADQVNVNTLTINTVSWGEYGPTYQAPVIEFVQHGTLPNGTYNLGTVGTVSGNLDDIVVEGLAGYTYQLQHAEGQLQLVVGTGQSIEVPKATIIYTELTDADQDNLYLPTVSIASNPFTLDGNTVTPSLSATFTDMNGNETDLLAMDIYSENYDNKTDADSWETVYAQKELINNDAAFGNYIRIGQAHGGGPRSAYTRLYNTGNDFYGTVNNYAIEFDAQIHYTSTKDNSNDNELILYGEGASMPYSNALFSSTNYVFKLTGGMNLGTTYTVAGNTTSYNYSDATWYHYRIEIDKIKRNVVYTISTQDNHLVGTGSYYITDNSINLNIQGIEIGLGRYDSYASIDNINIYKTGISLYAQNYENETAINGWISLTDNFSLVTGDNTYGKYLQYANSGKTRYGYTTFTELDVSKEKQYVVEFDAALSYSSGYDETIEFCVMSKGGALPNNWNGWDHYAEKNNQTHYLLDLVNQGQSSTIYTINNTETTTTLASGTWYHYTLVIDQISRTVNWSISNGNSGTFNIPTGTSSEIYGFYFVSPRNNSVFKLDNIKIHSIPTLSSYTFTEPGTLAVTSSYEGCKPSTATYSKVGVKISDVGYATFSNSQYNLDFSDEDDLTVYTVLDKGESVHLNEVGTKQIPAGNAVMLKGATGTENYYMATIPESVPALGENDLIANSTTITGAAGNIYVLGAKGVKEKEVGFYKLSANGELSAGKGYLLSEGNKAKYIGFDDEDDSTGITNVDALIPSDATIFNLQGQQVIQPLKKGVYIVNGQKILVK